MSRPSRLAPLRALLAPLTLLSRRAFAITPFDYLHRNSLIYDAQLPVGENSHRIQVRALSASGKALGTSKVIPAGSS